MKVKAFERFVDDFRKWSIETGTTSSIFLISANEDEFTTRIVAKRKHLKAAFVEVLVENPELIKYMDGACRQARLRLKHEKEEGSEK